MARKSLAVSGDSYFYPVISSSSSQYTGWVWDFYIPATFPGVVLIFFL
jgi:hypothetical protein